ncbi:MAG: response regulator [Candidatus Sungbacteria bacterium]|nr:response regulator [Candidatus Sungbacteria bacterium]
MKPKILIIDDDQIISEMYRVKFGQSGFDAEVFNTGKKAFEKIKEYEPDAVLLDIVMYPVDGFAVLEEVNSGQLKKKPKVVVLSNVGQKEEIEKGKTLGAADYIVKSNMTPSEVVSRVKEIIGE